MKTLHDQATQKINLVGKIVDATFGSGKTKTEVPYERATITLRVNQTYGGRSEISEIPVSMFASEYTSTGKPNPAFKTLQDLKTIGTIQTVGYDEAPTIHLNGATLSENNFVSRSGQLITGWQLRASFMNQTAMADVAAFTMDIFIMDMHPEEDRDGDSTGRLIVKGGVVQYGETLDVLEFIVEAPDSVDYIERNWNVNDTVTVKGRIRVTAVEEHNSGENSSWGEDVPETTTRAVRELIITKGDDQGKEEEFAYDPAEIKKGFQIRKARIEQMQIDATNRAKTANTGAAAPAASKYSWA